MSVKLSKAKHYLFLLAIILTNIVIMNDYVVMPVANNLYETFPDGVAGVNFILSGPAIFLFFGSLIAPMLFGKIHKKILLVISCGMFAVASIFGASVVSLGYIIVCRSICGLACGFVQVIALDIVADYFVDENKRASFLGIPNQFVFLAICTLCGGAYGMLFSYAYAVGPSLVAPQNISKAISYLTAGGGLAMFAGTYVVTAIMNVMPQHTVGAASLVFGIVCAGCLVVEFINTGKMKESV